MEYEKEFIQEQQYLDKTCTFIRENLQREEQACSDEKEQIISARKEMWENVSFRGGFDNAVEAHQALESIQAQSGRYDAAHKRIDHYRQALDSPYFARIDFTEQGFESSPAERIYIGLFTVQDEDSYEPYVYDWRTPIASLFYRYETGPVEYQAPSGTIRGTVSLKRQFEIKESTLNYFFDSDLNIVDNLLREALSHNTSPQMRSIVETIQRQQDMIIRDTQNELLFVQGVAGSGKTSVALHRVAFLLYEGVTQKLYANNIVIISPNNLFGSYIANVLPSLGEKNVASLTFEGLYNKICSGKPILPRSLLLEQMVCASTQKERELLHRSVEFFSSNTFLTILERYVSYYIRRMIDYTDLYYDGKLLETREQMSAFVVEFFSSNTFLTILERYVSYYIRRMIDYTDLYYDGKLLETREQMSAFVQKACRRAPLDGALKLLEQRLWSQIHKLRREDRLKKLQSFSGTFVQHLYDKKQFGRLLSIKESSRIKRQIRLFTTLDSFQLYCRLLCDRSLFLRKSTSFAGNSGLKNCRASPAPSSSTCTTKSSSADCSLSKRAAASNVKSSASSPWTASSCTAACCATVRCFYVWQKVLRCPIRLSRFSTLLPTACNRSSCAIRMPCRFYTCIFACSAATAFRTSARWWWMRRRIILRCISPSSKSCFRTPATPSWATTTRPSKSRKPTSSIGILQICSRTSVPA